MMKTITRALLTAALSGCAAAATPAAALTFTLVDYNGSVTGTPAEQGFRIATSYWSSVLTSNANVRLEIGYNPLATNVIGSTSSTAYGVNTADVYAQLAATGNSALDKLAVANLSPLTAAGGLQAYTNGYANATTKTGVDYSTKILDTDDSLNNTGLRVNGATLKALGYTGFNPLQRDGQVTFSSNFAFDFDPTDGIDSGKIDFIAVAIHEIGHALGFVSGVDIYDNSANAASGALNANRIFSTLDLFRYSATSGSALDLAVGSNAYFSLDGGKTALFGDTFSTGAAHGDGGQASHWKDYPGCSENIGIMDPTICRGAMGVVTRSDLAAFDAMGWNTNVDVLGTIGYAQTTADIYRQFAVSVPEPASWAMMVAGFAVLGGALRSPRARKARAIA